MRELSTVLALGAIGVQNGPALTVAILVGALAMVAVVLVVLIGVLLTQGHASYSSVKTLKSEYPEIVPAVQFAIPLLAATAVFFQIFIPIGTTLVNVNLADPLAILGGSLFAWYFVVQEKAPWRLSWLNGHVVLATAVMALSFLWGYYSFGWSDWAFTNKLLGWFVLLCYGATGALIVRASSQGLTLLVRTFVGAAYGVALLEILFLILKLLPSSIPSEFTVLPLEGFSQNRNAFSFISVTGDLRETVLLPSPNSGWNYRSFIGEPLVRRIPVEFCRGLCRSCRCADHSCLDHSECPRWVLCRRRRRFNRCCYSLCWRLYFWRKQRWA